MEKEDGEEREEELKSVNAETTRHLTELLGMNDKFTEAQCEFDRASNHQERCVKLTDRN